MTIKQGGVFGRNPTFNQVDASSLAVQNNISSATLTVSGDASAKSLTVSGNSAYGSGKIFTTSGEGLLLGARTGTFFDAGMLAAGLTNYVYTVATGTNNIKLWGTTTIGHGTGQSHPVNGNFAMANGNGIDFSATAGTGTSELFSDYEEGVFTPTAIGSATPGTPVYTTQIGTYTKVGDTVNFRAYVASSSISGSTGNLIIGGLPFASSSGSYSAVSITPVGSMSITADTVICGYIDSNRSYIDNRLYSTSGTTTISPVSPQAIAWIVSGQYKTG